MKPLEGTKIYTYTLEDLLGPLNDVEKKYAQKELYISGTLPIPLPGPRLSVIGSREASDEGLKAAATIVKVLVKNDAIVVSGLAKGIDTMAHRTAIEEGGYTIAVLGTPLNKIYPKENSSLQDYIMRNHLAISQFPIGYPTRPRDFVIRNRTMALISDASIIVEAGDSSGSLHQGWEALRLGRPLFIWKAIVNNSSLKWPKKMIEYGALELNDPEEIIDHIPTQEILNLAM
ncbi:DNA processing protein DprA [Candidatus Bathyarchaeota archaeon RBG_13_52_12]|nr:MAG: DNA processing protein DprA [Candidatus Bathyarchaeota archaeon RBG_13_52_12]